MKKQFEDRINLDVMNLLFSYGVDEDEKASSLGYSFLGAAYDQDGKEVHVFSLRPTRNSILADTQRLDWLESKSDGSWWIARDSVVGRGFRLHNIQTDVRAEAKPTARQAIDHAMEQEQKLKSSQVQPLIQDQDYEPN